MRELLDELISIYRGWHQLEQVLNPGGQALIDFDLAPVDYDLVEFHSRLEVLIKLQQMHTLLPSNFTFLQARIEASIYYLQALMGQQFSFSTYISHTMRLKPYLFSDQSIQEQRRKATLSLEAWGIAFDQQSTQDFEEKLLLTHEDEFRSRLLAAKDLALDKLSNFIQLPHVPRINLSFKREDAYWQNWISGTSTSEVTLVVNLHPRSRLYDGIPELLAYHEICGHAIQMSTWLQRIEQGELHPFYGVITVHSPEQFICEGLAQSLTDILLSDEEAPRSLLLAREYERYRLMIYNNAHVMINSHQPVAAVLSYVRQNVPFDSIPSIEAELRDRSYHPLLRTYQYVYAVSEAFFVRHIASRKRIQKQSLLSIIYSEPLTMQSLQAILRNTSAPAEKSPRE